MGLARAIADFIASGVRFVKLMSNSLQAVTSADDILPRSPRRHPPDFLNTADPVPEHSIGIAEVLLQEHRKVVVSFAALRSHEMRSHSPGQNLGTQSS